MRESSTGSGEICYPGSTIVRKMRQWNVFERDWAPARRPCIFHLCLFFSSV
jgi:hypothetical protein